MRKRLAGIVVALMIVSGLVAGPFAPGTAAQLHGRGRGLAHAQQLVAMVTPNGWIGGGSSGS